MKAGKKPKQREEVSSTSSTRAGRAEGGGLQEELKFPEETARRWKAGVTMTPAPLCSLLEPTNILLLQVLGLKAEWAMGL